MGKAVPEVMRRAFWQLRNGRGGPALVEVPLDVFREDVGDMNYVPSYKTRTGPDPEAVASVASVLASAERPVIYAGQGVHYAKAWDELKQLAEDWGIPVTTSLEGKSAFPETHPLSLGSGGRAIPETVHTFLQDADVIFGVGCSFALTGFGVQMPRGKTIIHATLDAKDLNKDVPAQHVMLGDAKLTLQALSGAMASLKTDDARDAMVTARKAEAPKTIQAMKSKWLSDWMPKLTSESAPISPYRVIWELNRLVDKDNTVITHDAGSPVISCHRSGRAQHRFPILAGENDAVGLRAWARNGGQTRAPEALCINVWGDAAIGFTGMDFETAVRERLPILSILLTIFPWRLNCPSCRSQQKSIEARISPGTMHKWRGLRRLRRAGRGSFANR